MNLCLWPYLCAHYDHSVSESSSQESNQGRKRPIEVRVRFEPFNIPLFCTVM